VLSNPLFLNLAVVGRLRPRQLLLECDEEQEVKQIRISIAGDPFVAAATNRALAAIGDEDEERASTTWLLLSGGG
jgi:hypothetical protein